MKQLIKYSITDNKSPRSNLAQSYKFYLSLCSLFSYLLMFLATNLKRLKINVLKGEKSPSAKMETVFTKLLLFGGMQQATRNTRLELKSCWFSLFEVKLPAVDLMQPV